VKKSIIDPLSNSTQFDLPTTVPGRAERKDVPEVSDSVTPVEEPGRSDAVDKLVLPKLITIRHKKMKKHQRRKLRKRMRFVMRRRRQLKEKKREREIQQYEREQVKLGQLYNPEQSVDEQLALARKSGWHVDIIAEFSRAGEKEKGAAAGGDSSDSNRKN